MPLPFPIAPEQTDAKSPIDQQLMDAIRLNQEFLDSQIGGGGSGGAAPKFKVNGRLNRIKALLAQGGGKRKDGAFLTTAVTFTKAALYLEKSGDSGALEVDVFRHKEVQHPIESIAPILSETIQSVGRLGVTLNTQAISRETPAISTQQINRAKAARNIQSIAALSNDQMLITFDGTVVLDADYKIGEQIIVSGADNGANNGSFTINARNIDGLPSLLVTNASAVDQPNANGTVDLNLFEYVYNAAVDPAFVVGENAVFSGHNSAINDGSFEIVRTNDGGNNIIVYNPVGQPEAVVAGTATCLRMRYTVDAAVDPEIYVIGEVAEFSGHASGVNNGQFPIVAINTGANDVTVYNVNNGAVQAGAGGNVASERWVYSLNIDPAGIIEVGDFVRASGQSQGGNNGDFEVKLVKKFGLNNFVIYNPVGVGQGAPEGVVVSAKKQINFREDFAAFYVADTSKVQLEGIQDGEQLFEYDVVEINRGGFNNYNIVVNAIDLPEQAASAGRVAREIRTIFLTRPKIDYAVNQPRNLQVDVDATFVGGGVEADTLLTLEILQVPEGLPSTMVLSLS